MTYDPHSLVIHIDGSAFDNPGGNGGIAGIAEFPDKFRREPETVFETGFQETTNQRAELLACIRALEWIRENAPSYGHPRAVIYTDSLYICENYKRVPTWKKEGWRNRHGRPVENEDLWKKLHTCLAKTGVRTEILYNRGKSTAAAKQVHKAAKRSARGIVKIPDRGFRGGDISRTKLPGDPACLFHANNQEAVIRVYRKNSFIRNKRVEGKIFFEILSEAGVPISKHIAYSSHEIEDGLHRHHGYRVQFNDNPNYPIILEVLEEVTLQVLA